MGTQNQTFSAKDLPLLASMISRWSSQGFQNFWRGGVFHDMLEVVKKHGYGVLAFDKLGWGMLKPSLFPGDMTRGQIREIIDCIPDGCWFNFRISFDIWSMTSGWWDENPTVGWELRDGLRGKMGLEPINPIRVFGVGRLQMVFRRVGHSAPPEEPIGYRYASPEEMKKVNLPEDLGIVIFTEGKWRFVIMREHKFSSDGTLRSEVADPSRFFHNNVVFVPLVKL